MRPIFSIRTFFFVAFFLSGFCGLVYQLVWLRLAYASFGIITPVMSVVLSVFMAGLGLGSWFGGKWSKLRPHDHVYPLWAYGLAEIFIGLGAFLVPRLLHVGEALLLTLGPSHSPAYLFFSALAILVALLPWCICMGTTYPFMMGYIRRTAILSRESFSFLYLSNILGALTGVFITAIVLIETLGFRETLAVAASVNFFIASLSLVLAWKRRAKILPTAKVAEPSVVEKRGERHSLLILGVTGFITMASEVVWTRAFTIVLKTQIYSFAALLFTYLLATALGSMLYRRDLQKGGMLSRRNLLSYAFLFVLVPVVLNDPRIQIDPKFVLLSIVPFCTVLGYLTPQLVDRFSNGDEKKAGLAYAVNITGCILGPLSASYFLLPWMDSKAAMFLLGLPLGILAWTSQPGIWKIPFRTTLILLLALVLMAQGVLGTVSYEESLSLTYADGATYRDCTSTVTAGGEGMGKNLLVNGIGMTGLTAVTKFMADLPMMFLSYRPHSALDICFGMGTTFRSLLTWGVNVTAVDLNPGVFHVFPYFHADAAACLADPHGHLVADDGRRYLKRCGQSFDVITIDPPPPVEAAGSSLLYSTEFYRLAKAHLNPGGILQQWFPSDEPKTLAAVTRSLVLSFKYVKAFRSIDGWGHHFIASDSPLNSPTTREMMKKLPETSKKDLKEWFPPWLPLGFILKSQLSFEVPVESLLQAEPKAFIEDDRPYNEYYLLRNRGHLAQD